MAQAVAVREPVKPKADELAQLRQLVTELQRRVEVLEAGRGLRDAEDAALVLAFVASTRGLDFSAAALWRHASVDPVLADAMEAADIDNPRQIGKFLRRVSGHTVAGWRIEQVGTNRVGIRWRLRVCEFETPAP
jgi:hypothetical protein